MKIFTFPAWCNYGGGDSRDSWVEVELTDEEAERLVAYGTQVDVYYGDFINCSELKDIYHKVYAIAVEQMTDELRFYSDDLDEKYSNDPNWKIDMLCQCGVSFPNEFEEMIIDEDEDEE